MEIFSKNFVYINVNLDISCYNIPITRKSGMGVQVCPPPLAPIGHCPLEISEQCTPQIFFIFHIDFDIFYYRGGGGSRWFFALVRSSFVCGRDSFISRGASNIFQSVFHGEYTLSSQTIEVCARKHEGIFLPVSSR